MFRILNIEEINKVSRELGNKVITKVSENIKESISKTYIFVRYMGPKFVIVFSGVEASNVADFINEIKDNVENLKISVNDNIQEEEQEGSNKKKGSKRKKKREDVVVSPALNFAVTTYYKGQALKKF